MTYTLTDLSNWKEITSGLFRYVVAAKACYEILVLDDKIFDDNFEDAKRCNLYLTGNWYTDDTDGAFFNRAKIMSGTMEECLNKANEDYKEWL